jgi:MoxR-like ATPase
MEDLSLKDLQKSGYFADQALLDVVNAARFLNKPLLIEGPAGTGKTFLAKTLSGTAGTGKTFLAKTLSGILNLELIRLQCHEGIDEDRAVYEWNYKKQLLSIQTKSDTSNLFAEEYLIKRPLLKALTSEVDNLLLIDEIDRADEEFEALLLEILAENQITIPEMGTITGEENKVIILTSNNTRELSDALRRRCIYLYLDFPNIEIEKKVLMNTVEGISEDEAIKYASLIAFVRNLNLNK